MRIRFLRLSNRDQQLLLLLLRCGLAAKTASVILL